MNIDIPDEWNRAGVIKLTGLVMVIGEPNTGKSTLSAYLYDHFSRRGTPAAYLDGDPGQSTLGIPTTIGLTLGRQEEAGFPPRGKKLLKFIGSTSPKAHMLPVLVGAGRLVEQARLMGCSDTIYDTSGLVDPAQGGLALKYAKIDLLSPAAVVAIQRENEIEPLLGMLKRSGRTRVIPLAPSTAALARDSSVRQDYRAKKFREYFTQAGKVTLDWIRYAIYPAPRFTLNRLVALEDRQGFTLSLGIVLALDREARQVELLTPLEDISTVSSISLGAVLVDPISYRDQQLGK